MGGTIRTITKLFSVHFLALAMWLSPLAYLDIGSVAEAAPKYAAIIVDNNTGRVLHARHADEPRYPASLTKIMTLYLVFKELKSGRITLDHKFVVTETAAAQPPSKLGLKAGTKISVRDAVRALVTKSANDVAVVIAENFAGTEPRFAEVMTVTASLIGMRNTVFWNASGLPDKRQKTTARDMATLSSRILDDFPKLSKYFKLKQFTYRGKRYRNHNGLLFNYRGTNGIKTGYTRASGFNLAASAQRGKKHLIGIVMGGKSVRKRNSQMRYLMNRAWHKASRVKTRVPSRAPVSPIAEAPRAPIQQPQAPSTNYNTSSEFKPSGAPQNGTVPLAQTGPYHVQIGAFETPAEAHSRLKSVYSRAQDLLTGHQPITMEVAVNNRQLVRARFSSFSEAQARSTCRALKRRSIQCIAVSAQ